MGTFFNFNGMRKYCDANSRFIRSLVILFFDRYSLCYMASWFIIRYCRNSHTPIPILNNWLTDFVFLPLVIHFSQVIVILAFGYSNKTIYSLRLMLIYAMYVSIFFEYFAPKVTSYNTADWMDVLAYFSGAIFYKYIHLPHLIKKIK